MVYVGASHVTQLVRQALARDPRTRNFVLEVSYNRGTCRLIGTVPSWRDREVVEEVALGQPGIDSLVLDIGVEQQGRDTLAVSENLLARDR